ncbi:hypothetical protein O181_001273 [Austropuccinia psidii MF-1]|uniref:Uncharacterized protein n=1 Tax=Austropuccinia psidii MF-1 TaxID=1389203 RepID=A0A9Q3GBK1_9BASI|nr:hypothetical protein [Austropuccinia psidii MF-1]
MASTARGPYTIACSKWDPEAPFGQRGPRRQSISPKASPWPLATIRGPHIGSKQEFSSSSGEDFPSLNALRTQGPGVVHIWYNIPLCTILVQQSNDDPFGTQLRDSKSSTQSITNFEGGLFSYSVWKFPGGYQKTIQEPQPPGPAGVGLYFLVRIIPRVISRVYQSLNQFSRHQVLHYSLDNLIGTYRL